MPLGQLLQRVDAAVVVDEAHDVAVDAAHDLDEALALPLRERLLPGQVEEVRMAGAREELELRGHVVRADSAFRNARTPCALPSRRLSSTSALAP